MILPFRRAPTIFNGAQLGVEFWQEEDIKSSFLAVNLKECLNPDKIWLVVKEAMNATVDPVWQALEARTFPLQLCFLDKTSLLEYHGHSFKDFCTRVAVR